MDLIPFILGLSIVPAIMFWSVLFALVFSTSIERSANYGSASVSGSTSGRWFIFFASIGLTGIYISTTGGSIPGTLINLKNNVLWVPLFTYIGIGLLYSLLEFLLDTRKAAKHFSAEWHKFNSANNDVILSRCIQGFLAAQDQSNNYNYNRNNRIITLTANSDYTVISPIVNPDVLSFHIAAWTLFWPFFLLAMLIGDVILKSFKYTSALIIKISASWVKSLFKNAFTLK
jgi:hypothetical protein